MLSEEETHETLKRLKSHPAILESLKGILDITEGAKGIEKADDAEFALIPEVRGLGKKFIEDWAKHQAEEKQAKAKKEHSRKRSKKSKLAYHFRNSKRERTMLHPGGKIHKAFF